MLKTDILRENLIQQEAYGNLLSLYQKHGITNILDNDQMNPYEDIPSPRGYRSEGLG